MYVCMYLKSYFHQFILAFKHCQTRCQSYLSSTDDLPWVHLLKRDGDIPLLFGLPHTKSTTSLQNSDISTESDSSLDVISLRFQTAHADPWLDGGLLRAIGSGLWCRASLMVLAGWLDCWFSAFSLVMKQVAFATEMSKQYCLSVIAKVSYIGEICIDIRLNTRYPL